MKSLITLLLIFGMVAFAQQWPVPKPKDKITPGNGGPGGGFLRSDEILENAVESLAAGIRGADPAVFKNMPLAWTADKVSNWTPEKMAQTIEKIERAFTETVPGTNDRRTRIPKMYDYDFDQKKLFVLNGFLIRYEGRDIAERAQQNIEDVEHDLLHEFAHLLNIGRNGDNDKEARAFANEFWNRLRECPKSVTQWTPEPGQEDLRRKYESAKSNETRASYRDLLGGPKAGEHYLFCKGVESFEPYSSINQWRISPSSTCDQTYRVWEEDLRYPALLGLILPEITKTRRSELFVKECIGFQPDRDGLTPVALATAPYEDDKKEVIAGRGVTSLRVTSEGTIVGKMSRYGNTYMPKRESWCPVTIQPTPNYFECAYDKHKFDPIRDRTPYERIGKVCVSSGVTNRRGKTTMGGAGYADLDVASNYYRNSILVELKKQGKLGLDSAARTYKIKLTDEKDYDATVAALASYLREETCEQAYITLASQSRSAPVYPGGRPVDTTDYIFLRVNRDGSTEVIE